MEIYPSPILLDAWPDRIENLTQGRYIVRISVCELLSGESLCVTLHIIRNSEGPILGLLAGIHGDEITGIRCIRHLLCSNSIQHVRGTIIAIPVANPLAWQARQRISPEKDVEETNLARVFNNPLIDINPLTTPTSITRQIAYLLEKTFFSSITHLIDYHNFGQNTAVRLVLYRQNQTENALRVSEQMAKAMGLGVIRKVLGNQGTTSAYAADHAIPTCVAEWGSTNGNRQVEDRSVELGANGALRVLKTLGMLSDAPSGPEKQLIIERVVDIAPKTSGYFMPAFDLEDLFQENYPCGIPVQVGQKLGEVFEPYTLKLIDTVCSPIDGYIIALFRGGPYQIGGRHISIAAGQIG